MPSWNVVQCTTPGTISRTPASSRFAPGSLPAGRTCRSSTVAPTPWRPPALPQTRAAREERNPMHRSVPLLALGAALLAAGPAQAATVTFASTGAEQTFVVPPGVTSLHVVAVGGAGANGGAG